MKYGVLGTGMVGQTIGSRLAELGHEVMMGSRSAGNEKAQAWAACYDERARAGTFAEAAGFGERIFNCTAGTVSLAALELAGPEALGSKLLIDVANPLDFSQGFPPRLTVCNDDSLGEQIQRAYPALRVVKTLNTMNCSLMVDPARVGGGEHHVFVCGNDAGAKAETRGLLQEFGWDDAFILDLGDISQSRGTEAWLPLWVRLYGALGTGDFNIRVMKE